MVDLPLSGLVEMARERAEAEALATEAGTAPAMGRFRALIDFVGTGRTATAGGNLTGSDAAGLAASLGLDRGSAPAGTALAGLPETAHLFRWALAAGFIERRGTKLVAGPMADALDEDPVTAWISAAAALIENGVLDGFQDGWRKSYVTDLDSSMGDLLIALGRVDVAVPVDSLADDAWRMVADAYGFEPDDEAERRSVRRLMTSAVAQLAHAGVVTFEDGRAGLSRLGQVLALLIDMASDDGLEDGDLDPADIDAESMLLMCEEEELEGDELRANLGAWCESRSADEAADELIEAMRDIDEPYIWALGFEALSLLDPGIAVPKVRQLRSDRRLAALAEGWLDR